MRCTGSVAAIKQPKKGGIVFVNKRYLVLGLILVVALICLNCAPGSHRWDQEISPGHMAGFWVGIWHGLIIIVTFIISLFTNQVGIYEASNTGWPYNLGFLIGLFLSVGGGLRLKKRTWKKRWPRKEREWDEIGEKVEEKVRKGINAWLDETEKGEKEKEWEEIGKRIEEKIKEALKKWSEKE